MNYADIIWKLVEKLLDEKTNEEPANDKNNTDRAED